MVSSTRRRNNTRKRKVKGGNPRTVSRSRGRSRSRDRVSNSRGILMRRDRKDIPDSYISAAIHTYWMEYLKDLPKTKELHIVGPDRYSGHGIPGWIRWFRGIPHPDTVEKDLDAQERFFIQKLKASKEAWPEVLDLAKIYQDRAVRQIANRK